MPKLSDTIARPAAARRELAAPSNKVSGKLGILSDFGSNPGALNAKIYLPPSLRANAPLVVVLHGCTQTADGYDHGAGWSTMADRHGFALLFPEQRRANNANLCFNWFVAEDIAREGGEALSIRQMINHMIASYALDRDRVFVTGLSAGGAMASVMLAVYPDLFAGGAIIAGLPYGVATSLPRALEQMRGVGSRSEAELGALIRAASAHPGPWPKISVWHGTADMTVVPSNMHVIIEQWRAVHRLPARASVTQALGPHTRQVWQDARGDDCIESYTITGMGHGTPIAPTAPGGVGAAGPYMIDAGISSTAWIIKSWGVASDVEFEPDSAPLAPQETATRMSAKSGITAHPKRTSAAVATGESVTEIINGALRAAGLLR